ncbi:FxsA family protein [Actinophytocola sp.]|uniref:FxsA family protein n=1 Tax=Actinophytocola sp. TaxID=1872138 RepID=UPI00389AFC33
MPVFALLLLAVVAELAVIIAVGQAIGALTTILLLVAVSVLGVSLLRRQGMRTLTTLTDAARNRRDPSPAVTDGVLLAVAAALVVFPGFLSDIAALFLLFPPTRGLVRRRLLRRAATRRRGYAVVDGEVVDDDEVTNPEVIVIDSRRED